MLSKVGLRTPTWVTVNVNKNEHRGIYAVNDKPRCANIWNRHQLNFQVNILDDLIDYIDMTKEIHETRSTFFWLLIYF